MARTMPGPIVLYLLVAIMSGIAAMPACRLAFGDARRIPLVSVSVTVGTPLALLLFSLIARMVEAYAVAVPLTLLAMTGIWAWGRSQCRRLATVGTGEDLAAWDVRADVLLLGTYAVVLGVLVCLRAGWPSIFWVHDYAHVGSEKLFNFSLIQAFLFGEGYPPENLWLAGEPIDYYVFLHALPGLVAWAWRVLTGDPSAGSGLFVFSDAFLLLLGSFALSAWSCALLASGDNRLTQRQAAVVGIGLGIGVLLSVHAKAVSLVLGALFGGTDLGWWALEREVVPYTYSQYPFFLLLQGDHHAFQRVFFLQVALYGTVALLLSATRPHWPRVLLVGALAAAVQLSHSGSVLLDLVVFGIAAMALAGVRWWRGERQLLQALLVNIGATAAVALVLSLPAVWRHNAPSIRWYWVETSIASPLLEFLAAQAGPLAFFLAACTAGLLYVRARARAGQRFKINRWVWLSLAIAALMIAVGRPGAAVAITCALLVLVLAPGRSPAGEDRAPLLILAAAVFGVWLLPEFIVGDFAHRQVVEWKRWNLAMRFWLEGHYLIPFLAVIAFAPTLGAALNDRRYVRAMAAAAGVVGALWLTTHAYALADRLARTPDRAGLDSGAFLQREYSCDAAIVDHLRRVPPPVRIGELCGTAEFIPQIPLDYGWAGRIAAFSGRPGICGWSRHVQQFSPELRHGAAAGTPTWQRFREYEIDLRQAYLAAEHHRTAVRARASLDGLGVTHVVLGVQEQNLFPGLTAGSMAAALGGTVEYSAGEGCAVIRLTQPDGAEQP
jgi:uncharacterized membrane protein